MSKKIDYLSHLPLINYTLAQGGRFPLRVSGTSMEPFIREGDRVFIEAVKEPLKLGDVIFADTPQGPVMHRITSFENGMLCMTGDAQIIPFGPFSKDSVIGAVYEFEHNGKKRKANTKCIRFFVKLNRTKCKLGKKLSRQP